jgi:hypothetical protein
MSKNIYIGQEPNGNLMFIGYKDQLDEWLKDGSLNEDDVIYIVTGQMKVIAKTTFSLKKQTP